MTDQPVVKTVELTKAYGEFVALDRLSMTLERGQILGFIGPNGAGKTTTIKILVGLARPTSGQAFVAGCDCSRGGKQLKRLIGYMPDTFGSYDNMRVREYLDFFGAAFSISRKQRQARIDQCMNLAGCSYMRDLYCESLSHGMKQRVAIARTLLHDPQVLILDEPANGLDPNARIEMRQILLKLSEMGKTLIVTSHILPELARVCDVVAIITKGKLRAFGTLEQIMQRIRQRQVMEVELLPGEDLAGARRIITDAIGEPDAVSPSEAEGIIRFSTEKDEQAIAALLVKLTQAGVKIAQYRQVDLDLEDAFLQVTQSEAMETEAGSATLPDQMPDDAVDSADDSPSDEPTAVSPGGASTDETAASESDGGPR